MKLKDFIEENINIQKDKYARAIARKDEVIKTLKNFDKLDRFDYQGSFSRKTLVRPKFEGDEFDIDILAISDKNMDAFDMDKYAHEINEKLTSQFGYESVSKYGGKPTKATQVYFNKEFHVDVVPLNNLSDNEFIFDSLKKIKILSNPTHLSKAFNSINNSSTNNSLRDSVKIVKYLRNLLNSKHKVFDVVSVPSIVIDIFMLQNFKKLSTYEQEVIHLLSKFNDKFTSPIHNVHCEGEIIDFDTTGLNFLKSKIEDFINSIAASDFTGMKRFVQEKTNIGKSTPENLVKNLASSMSGIHVSSSKKN